MEEPTGSTGPTDEVRGSSFTRPIVIALVLLLVSGIGFTGYAAWELMTGATDRYLNQHLRLFASGLGQVLLVGAMLANRFKRSLVSGILLAGCFGVVAWSLVLLSS